MSKTIKIKDNQGREIELEPIPYSYDEKCDKEGRLIFVMNPDGTTEEWKYDNKGNVIWYKYPDGTVEERGYDADGNQVWMRDTSGVFWIPDHLGGKPYREVKKK